jgi:Tfp pilus assembly protein FimT
VVELILVVVLIGILAGIALPTLGRIRTSAALRNGRAALTSALATARSAATRWGRTSVLRIDADADALWVVVDTSDTGSGADTVVLTRFDLRSDMGLDLRSDRAALCFDSRGVGTTAAACPATGARLILVYGAVADTLLVNVAGRLW